MDKNNLELIKQYRHNEAEIKRLRELITEERGNFNKEERKIGDFYHAKIQKLAQKEYEAKKNIKELNRQFTEVTDKRIDNLLKVIVKVKRIKVFLNLDKDRSLEIDDGDLKPKGYWRKDDYFEPLGYLINDDFLVVKLYIVSNDRPKNKYSLEAVGKCHFHNDLIHLPYQYGLTLDTINHGLSLARALKFAPTIEEIKQYIAKGKENIIQACKGDYDEVKTEYLEVINNYSIEDFEGLEEAEQ